MRLGLSILCFLFAVSPALAGDDFWSDLSELNKNLKAERSRVEALEKEAYRIGKSISYRIKYRIESGLSPSDFRTENAISLWALVTDSEYRDSVATWLGLFGAGAKAPYADGNAHLLYAESNYVRLLLTSNNFKRALEERSRELGVNITPIVRYEMGLCERQASFLSMWVIPAGASIKLLSWARKTPAWAWSVESLEGFGFYALHRRIATTLLLAAGGSALVAAAYFEAQHNQELQAEVAREFKNPDQIVDNLIGENQFVGMRASVLVFARDYYSWARKMKGDESELPVDLERKLEMFRQEKGLLIKYQTHLKSNLEKANATTASIRDLLALRKSGRSLTEQETVIIDDAVALGAVQMVLRII